MKIKSASTLPILTVIVLVVIIGIAAGQAGTAERDKNAAVAEPYAYAQLGVDCASAAETYTEWAVSLDAQASDFSMKFTSQITATKQQINSSTNSAISDMNSAKNQFWDLYVAGGMTRTEYDAKIMQLDQLTETAYVTPSSTYSAELDRIERDGQRTLDDMRAKVIDFKDNASKLKTCATSAENEQPFNVSDQADFQLLIDKLNTAS